jgi:hypothetical protein
MNIAAIIEKYNSNLPAIRNSLDKLLPGYLDHDVIIPWVYLFYICLSAEEVQSFIAHGYIKMRVDGRLFLFTVASPYNLWELDDNETNPNVVRRYCTQSSIAGACCSATTQLILLKTNPNQLFEQANRDYQQFYLNDVRQGYFDVNWFATVFKHIHEQVTGVSNV